MSKEIITISREFGSGGRYLGKQVADKLGIAFYDKDIIAKVAEESGLTKEYVEKYGEHSPKGGFLFYALEGKDFNGFSVNTYLASIQQKVIRDIADQGPCVIVGRGADYILREREDCLSVFIYGEEAEKTARIQQLYDKTESEAKKMMKEMDKKRSANYNYYTDRLWGAPHNYSLCLNSSTLGYERCVDFIIQSAK